MLVFLLFLSSLNEKKKKKRSQSDRLVLATLYKFLYHCGYLKRPLVVSPSIHVTCKAHCRGSSPCSFVVSELILFVMDTNPEAHMFWKYGAYTYSETLIPEQIKKMRPQIHVDLFSFLSE